MFIFCRQKRIKNHHKTYTKTYTKNTQLIKEPTETYRKLPFVVMEHVQKNLSLMLKLKFSVLLDVCCSCSVERKRKFQMFQSFRQNDFLQTITGISTDKIAFKRK